MKDEQLGKIKPILFEEKLIIALDSKWLDFFKVKDKDAEFAVSIKNDRLTLISPKIIKKINSKDND